MSARFSKSYIRKQPEYRYLVNKDTEHVIQTCFEDGQIKLRFGVKEEPPHDNTSSHQRNAVPQKRGGSTLSHSSVFHLTGRGYHGNQTEKDGEREKKEKTSCDESVEKDQVSAEGGVQADKTSDACDGEVETSEKAEANEAVGTDMTNDKSTMVKDETEEVPDALTPSIVRPGSTEAEKNEDEGEDQSMRISVVAKTRRHGTVEMPDLYEQAEHMSNGATSEDQQTEYGGFYHDHTNINHGDDLGDSPIVDAPANWLGFNENAKEPPDESVQCWSPPAIVVSDLTAADTSDYSEDMDVINVDADIYLDSEQNSARDVRKDWGRFITHSGDRVDNTEGCSSQCLCGIHALGKPPVQMSVIHVKLNLAPDKATDSEEIKHKAEFRRPSVRRVSKSAAVVGRSGSQHVREQFTGDPSIQIGRRPSTTKTNANDNSGGSKVTNGGPRRWTVASPATANRLSIRQLPSRQVSWATDTHTDDLHNDRKRNYQDDRRESVGNTKTSVSSPPGTDRESGDVDKKAEELLRRLSVVSLMKQAESRGPADVTESLPGTRRVSTVSGPSRRASRVASTAQSPLTAEMLARRASQYDPKVERSESYMHQRGNSFNKASQYLTPVTRGVRNLQVHYSQTNTAHNDGLIFAHLLRAAHVRNTVVEEGVYSLERRLYNRRHGHSPHATTFYDTGNQGKARKQKDTRAKTVYGTVAKKKKERRERIKKKNEEIEMGYTPRAASLKQLGPEDMDLLLKQCRHLRVDPQYQQHLYRTDREFWDSSLNGKKRNVQSSVYNGALSTPRSAPAGKV